MGHKECRATLQGTSQIHMVLLTGLLLLAGCSSSLGGAQEDTLGTYQETTDLPNTAPVVNQPFPYTIPLPAPTPTLLDGVYTKTEHKDVPRVPCKRCPDYATESGPWKLHLDKGVFRVRHQDTAWQSIGSFVVSIDRSSKEQAQQLVLFNDPNCPQVVGLYNWKLEEGRLSLEVIEDACAIRLRGENLSHLPWLSCQPPSIEAGATDHWPKPDGCD